jgi:hypothetical protein
MLHLLLAIVLTQPAPASPPADPCKTEHRLFCGPIRIVPRNPQRRNAFVANMIASVVDGVVTNSRTRGNPALEGNPIMRPFIRGGVAGMLLGWGSMEVTQHFVARTFHLSDARLDSFALAQHVSGVASWLSPRTYGWMPNEWAAYHQPIAESAWIRYNATAGKL